MSRSLLDLIKEPFGPFLEEEALTSTVPNTTLKNVVALECLLLEGNGRITGLDECEKFQPEYNKELFEDEKVPVRFHGILEIQRLTWLTPEAHAAIEEELRNRDLAAHPRSNSGGRTSGLTLKNLYGPSSQLKVKVKIQGTQANSAVYLFCSNFHANNRTPLEKRTPKWFVERYCKHLALHGPARLHRPIFSQTDSDIERNTPGRMKRGREHVLRHVSRAEVYSRIAEHAEWLIHEQSMDSLGKWIDVEVWRAWLRRLDYWRRMARESGRSFGVWDGDEVDIEDDMSVDDLPLPPDPIKRKKKPTKKNTRRTSGVVAPTGADLYPPQLPEVDLSMMRTYDPDFSPPSTTLGSPVSPPSRPGTPTDPSLLEALPLEMFHPPNVNSLLIWPCPWKGCFHLIDLLHLTNEDLDHPEIPEEDKRRLRSKNVSWDGNDIWARDAFAYMVDKHHRWHLEELGIAIGEVNSRYRLRWKTPASHPQPSQFRQVKVDDRDPIPEQVKEEDL
uniref:Hemagglutinin-like protein n=1 Tax=Ganoderma boninense TaxID=34458 RepID=A0A5K1JWK2_9APHY|nr:Hemagglutinin-like protein [Ganoderma boninense]